MTMRRIMLTCIALGLIVASGVSAQEKLDYALIDKIRDEGFNRSQVIELASYMSDVYGPRFSNSPSFNRAAQWARKKFEEWGITAEIEPYGEVGLGWENRYTSVHMLAPEYQTFIAYPRPWTRGTEGKITRDVTYINTQNVYSPADLERYSGTLKGAIIFIQPKRRLVPNFKPVAVRLPDEELDDMSALHILPEEKTVSLTEREYSRLREGNVPLRPLPYREIQSIFDREGAALLVAPGGPQRNGAMDKGIVAVNSRAPLPKDAPKPMPSLLVSAEHYNRVLRILEKGIDVEMEAEIRVAFDEEDTQDYNIIAEIPGTDLKNEIVMLGGHFDAESAGTGATDNAAGSSVVMEAMRILKAVGARPRRTIRAALWGGEEAGHLGSRAYVKHHFGGPEVQDRLPDYDNFSVYFNTDWYGRFRGIFLHGHDLVRPMFEAWMQPFHDLGFTVLSPGNSAGTDNMSFIAVGLPGFKFIQDDLEYWSTTWHTNMDVYDRLVPEDLMGNAVILASFAYNAATRDEKLPRTKNQMNNSRRWYK